MNKIGLTIRGAITNAALLLLGRPESTSLLSPAVARITWILKDDKNQDLILLFIGEHGPVSRKDIDVLLLDKLPELLQEGQKISKIHNLLSVLSREKRIYNTGTRKDPKWILVESSG